MLKTNSKKAMENVRKYILKNVDFSGYDEYENVNVEDFQEVAKAIMQCFHDEKLTHDKRRLSYYEFFVEWCSGLPSCLDTCYYYNRSAVADLANILEETQEEASKFTEEQAEAKLTYLIYKALYKVVQPWDL